MKSKKKYRKFPQDEIWFYTVQSAKEEKRIKEEHRERILLLPTFCSCFSALGFDV